MHTLVRSSEFESKVRNKYSEEVIDQVIDQLAMNPRQGKKFQATNNIYKIGLGGSVSNRHEYELVYYYESKQEPILIINIFKKNEKDVLSKAISNLVNEAL